MQLHGDLYLVVASKRQTKAFGLVKLGKTNTKLTGFENGRERSKSIPIADRVTYSLTTLVGNWVYRPLNPLTAHTPRQPSIYSLPFAKIISYIRNSVITLPSRVSESD